MNNKDYLEQISSEARPLTKKAPGFFGDKLNLSMTQLKLIGGILISITLVFFIGIIATSGNKNGERDYVDQAYLRTTDLSEVIDDYRTEIRSSSLRSMAMSLKSVLLETNYILSSTLTNDFGVEDPDEPAKQSTIENEEALVSELRDTLEAARLNAVLDRVFAREFTYQISLLISLETDVLNRTKKEPFKTNLTSSRTNLETLHTQFDDFVAN
jgi:hypothetical protein